MNAPLSKGRARSLVLATAVAAAFAGSSVLWANNGANSGAQQAASPPAAVSQVKSTAGLPQFGDVYEQVAPTVVSVRTVKETPAQPTNSGGGMGSGFIISAEGHILTNAHVVDGATEVTVALNDEREFKAQVMGSDRRTDVALLKIEATGLPVARIGDTAGTRVGDWVAALGAPFGFTQTLTAGIVSAKSRSLPNEAYVPFIQTDAALNPGNSGGPLLNTQGEVIGISSQIYSPSGGYAGLSFAIPIDVAVKIKDQLQQYGKVTRGRIGVAIQNLNKELAESFGLSNTKGALISSIEKQSPAAAAGLQQGDVITAVNGKVVENAAELSRTVGELKPGEKARVNVVRGGATQEIEVTLDELPTERVAGLTGNEQPTPKLGVQVRPTTTQEREALGEATGVVVEQVTGPAARAGIRQGDVILALNNKPVRTPDDLRAHVQSAGKRAALLVQRAGARIYVPVNMG